MRDPLMRNTLLADSWILRDIHFSVLPDPRLDRNELRYVTWYAALQDRAVPPDHVLGENFRLIRLRDDCTENRDSSGEDEIPSFSNAKGKRRVDNEKLEET